jgi:hypothetical protein
MPGVLCTVAGLTFTTEEWLLLDQELRDSLSGEARWEEDAAYDLYELSPDSN